MHTNHLLLKDDVGASKPTTRKLPPDTFVYGKPEIRDKEGVGDGKIFIITTQLHTNGTCIETARITTSTRTLRN